MQTIAQHPYQNQPKSQYLENILAALEKISKERQRVWRALMYYKKHEFVFPSHKRLSKDSGVSESTVRRAIEEFIKLGWIKTIQRYNKSLIYLFDSIFDLSDVQKALSIYFISFALLMLPPKPRSNGGEQLSNIKNFYVNKNLRISESNTVGAREGNSFLAVIQDVRSETKKEKVMNKEQKIEWGNAIKELHKKVPLKKHGIAKLSAFPAEAIREVMKSMIFIYRADTPFQYLISLCDKYCSSHAIQPDWAEYKTICSGWNIQEGDRDYIDTVAFEKLREYQQDEPKTQYQKGEVSKSVSKESYKRPNTGPNSEYKHNVVRDEKFVVIGKLGYLDGDPLFDQWREKEKNFDEYAAILQEGFLKQMKELNE